MTDWVVLATAPDGAARVVHPGQLRLELPDAPDEVLPDWLDHAIMAWKEEVVRAALKQGLSNPAVVPAGSLVLKHELVEAWVRNGNQVVVDMDRARVVQMDRIRFVRDEKLKSLDAPAMIAFEQGKVDEYGVIVKLRQTLREIPKTFDLSGYKTPEELLAAWPKELQ